MQAGKEKLTSLELCNRHMLEGLVPDCNDEVVVQNFLCIFIFAFFATARVAKRAELRAKRFICYYIAYLPT